MSTQQTIEPARRIDASLVDYPRHVRVGGAVFDNVTLLEAVDRVAVLIDRGEPSLVVTPNVDHIVRLKTDPSYGDLVSRAELVLADGQPIVWASRLLGTPLKMRVAGSDLAPALCERAATEGWRIFFLGGDPGRDGQPDAASAAKTVLEQRYPALQIVGTYCPAFGFDKDADENRRIVELIRAAKPDIVLVGLGSPKQEIWIDQHKQEYGAAVSIGVGVSFSFIAGQISRAPLQLRNAGLEWAWRLACEPRRLWRRYLIRGTRFLPIVMRDLWRQRHELSNRGRGLTAPKSSAGRSTKTEATLLATYQQTD